MTDLTARPAVISITSLGPGDAGTLESLHAATFPRPWRAQEFERILTGTGAFGLAARAPVTHAPAGFSIVRAIAGEAEIISLGVVQSIRRLGLGRALLAASIDKATRKRCARIFLEVAVDNMAARQLYAEAGFADVGRRKAYYRRQGSDPMDAILLTRRLDVVDVAGTSA